MLWHPGGSTPPLPTTLKKVPIQELYIDFETDLPAGTVLTYPSGKIDAAYFYRDLDTNVELTDEDMPPLESCPALTVSANLRAARTS